MPPKEINDENFKGIQRHAIPLVDSLDTALARIIAFYDRAMALKSSSNLQSPMIVPRAAGPIVQSFDPYSPPDLTHTKVTFATFGSHSLDAPTWNSLLDEVVRTARRELGSLDALKKIAMTNLVDGQKTDHGYRYLSDVALSVQGQSANDAWRSIARITRSQDYRVQVHFVWYNKEAAAHPGEGGCFAIEGGG